MLIIPIAIAEINNSKTSANIRATPASRCSPLLLIIFSSIDRKDVAWPPATRGTTLARLKAIVNLHELRV
jgi:hypothetical protein